MVARITCLVKLFHKETQSELEHLSDLSRLEHLIYNSFITLERMIFW